MELGRITVELVLQKPLTRERRDEFVNRFDAIYGTAYEEHPSGNQFMWVATKQQASLEPSSRAVSVVKRTSGLD